MSQIDMSQYKKDARGNLVPIANIRPIDLLRDELVQKITARARAVQEELREYRRWAMDEIAAFAELSANQYGTSLGGKKGNIRLHSFDGQYRVQLAMQDALVFDEGLAAAKVLIDECIREYSEGSRPELLAIINAAFATDRDGTGIYNKFITDAVAEGRQSRAWNVIITGQVGATNPSVSYPSENLDKAVSEIDYVRVFVKEEDKKANGL